MELKSTLIETVIKNEDLIKISEGLERRYGIRPDVVLNKLYDTKDGNELLIRCFNETGASKAIVTLLLRGSLTKMVKEQIMFKVYEGQYGIESHLLTEYENKDYNLLIDEIIMESFNIKKA